MTALTTRTPTTPVEYPENDGKPLSSNSEQGRWIVVLFNNLSGVLREVPDVFLAVDLLWHPVENDPEIRNAPDVMVVFGRPRRKRSSYRQWEEDDVPVTVAFEILSPGNTLWEMAD
jgi:Uma2 family endonuclease